MLGVGSPLPGSCMIATVQHVGTEASTNRQRKEGTNSALLK
jgi:hypothetical protein